MELLPKEKVIVAAKSKLYRYKISQALQDSNYDIIETLTGPQTLAQLHDQSVVAVFIAEQLADMDAFTLLDNIHCFSPEQNPRLILIEGHPELRPSYQAAGIDAFLHPPFLPEMVLFQLEQLIHPEHVVNSTVNNIERKLGRFTRFAIPNLTVIFHTPLHERTLAENIGFRGLKAKTELLEESHAGMNTKVQVIHKGDSLLIQARIMWVRNGQAGLIFQNPKPIGFKAKLEDITGYQACRSAKFSHTINDAMLNAAI